MTDRIVAAVGGVLEQVQARGKALCVALSGGVDSVVLLDTLDRLRAELGLRLSALHVNHQISRHAGDWQAFCEELCRTRGIALEVRRVRVDDDGSGVEAAARMLRYQAYARTAADYVVLAHHLDDQAETFLLQLLRGAGPKGLSAMPVTRRQGPGEPQLLRPLLGVLRADIEAVAQARGLKWIVDDSNADSRYDRNFLRNELLPLLESRFPGYRETLTRASRNMSDHLVLAEEMAALDMGEAPGGAVTAEQLRGLSDARALNLLRALFARHALPMPPRAMLEEALRQVRAARPDAEMQVRFGSHALRCYRGRVEFIAEDGMPPPGWQAQWDGRSVLALPDGMGTLRPLSAIGTGIATRHFSDQAAWVRSRSGGESMKPGAGRPTRTLKNLLQENAVPPWERARMPLLFFGDRLAWVPGIGVAAEFRAGAAEPGIEPQWDRA
jgi:tRNA(Ile)-lysidine synthase